MGLVAWLQRYTVFRVIWHILKNYWWVIAIIVFWPLIDQFLMRYPAWLSVKLRSMEVWEKLIVTPPFSYIRNFCVDAWEYISGLFAAA